MFTEPVAGKNFFGRQEILEILAKRLDALKSGYRQNVALTGQMLSGKSSIIRHFLECFIDASIIPVYIEMIDEPFRSFADKFMATLLYNYLKSENIPVSKNMGDLVAKAENIIPRTIELVKRTEDDLAKRHYNRAYRQILDMTSVLKEETNKSCIVILDEFHNLENFKIRNPYLYLGKIIMVQKGTMYIVSSSQKYKIRKILSERLSLLFGNFEIIEVSGFDAKTAKTFLREKISPLDISEYYIDYILNLTDKNPFYLDMISRRLKTAATNLGISRVNVELIKSALTDLLYSATGPLNQYFTNSIHFLLDKNSRRHYLDILRAVSCGGYKMKDISLKLKAKTMYLSKKLDYLAGLDLIFKCGIFYKIQDRIFEFWLRNVYFRKETALVDDPEDRIKEFKGFIENDVENYLIEYNKAVIERLQDLFRSFDADIVEIEKRIRKLPRFDRIEILKYGQDKNYLICEKDRKYWVCRLLYSKAYEADIVDFIQENDERIKSATRKILIPLGDIDSNALLLAKEKHIWVWREDFINYLLYLYGKQDLIV